MRHYRTVAPLAVVLISGALIASGPARADVVTQTFSVPGVSVNSGSTSGTGTFSAAAFNSSLGTLTGVELDLGFDATIALITLARGGSQPATFQYGVDLSSLGHTLTIGSSSLQVTVPSSGQGKGPLLIDFAPTETFVEPVSGAGQTINFNYGESLLLLSAPIAQLVQDITTTYTIDYSYIYTPTGGTSVPEPSTEMLMAGALCMLGLAVGMRRWG